MTRAEFMRFVELVDGLITVSGCVVTLKRKNALTEAEYSRLLTIQDRKRIQVLLAVNPDLLMGEES